MQLKISNSPEVLYMSFTTRMQSCPIIAISTISSIFVKMLSFFANQKELSQWNVCVTRLETLINITITS